MSNKVKGSLFSKFFNPDYEKSKRIMERLGGISGEGKPGFAQSSFLLSPEKQKKYNDDFEKKVKLSQGGNIHRLMSGSPVTGQQQQPADLSMLRQMPTQQPQGQQVQQPAAPSVPASAYDLVSKEEKIQFLSELFAQSSIKGLQLSGADIREIFDEQWRNRGQEE